MIRSFLLGHQLISLEKKFVVRSLFNSQHPAFKQSNSQLPDYDLSDEHIVVKNDHKKKDEEKKDNKEKPTFDVLLMKTYNYNENDAKSIVEKNAKQWKYNTITLKKAFEFLNNMKISSKTILANPWLLGADRKYVESKFKLISKLEPRDINDFIPLFKLPTIDLYHLEQSMKRDKAQNPQGNLIYYFSERLGLEPLFICERFAKHLFIFDIDFDQIKANIDVMLEYNILPIHIITDLWSFRYDAKKAAPVLEACREAGRVNLKPWMIRSSPKVLKQMLALSQAKKDLLGENTIVEYLSERLQIDNMRMRQLVDRIPVVAKTRVQKVEKVLNFLLIEENFHPEEIAVNLRVLLNSLETTKKRVKELKYHGCRPSSLAYVCYSSKQYQLFLDKWIQKGIKMNS